MSDRVEDVFAKKTEDEIRNYGIQHPTELAYRVELSRRISIAFDNADTLLIFDDIDLVLTESDRVQSSAYRGCDRSLLPALWFSSGFKNGGKIIVYAPPNPVEMKSYLKLKTLFEEKLQRPVPIEILYETEEGSLIDILNVFIQNETNYTNICERFAQQQTISSFYSEFHLDIIKRHVETITKDSRRMFIFPYEMSPVHKQILQSYANKFVLPDIPSMDKAEHNLLLRSHDFQDIPFLLAVSSDGTIINDYDSYCKALTHLSSSHMKKTPCNIEAFARGVIHAVDSIRKTRHVDAFIKLDAKGAGGWSNVAPHRHPFLYDSTNSESERVDYLTKYVNEHIVDEMLPSIAVVEEFIQPEKRPGNVDADYAVAGFVLNGRFFPTSINILGAEDGRYIEMWTSSKPDDILDSSDYWQRIFESCIKMASIEAPILSYMNGIYAIGLFVTVEGHIKQRDWNIRRGGRSGPETLAILGIPLYETSVTMMLNDFGINFDLTNVQLFRLYTNVCEQLVHEHHMYIISSAYGYCGKDYSDSNKPNDFLKFDILINIKYLVDENGQILSKCNHRQKVKNIIHETMSKIDFEKLFY